ncbi:hypothetical protein HU200_026855 [Digitaria exilis]|uniref:Uncharacterized protein n=1 Tax=Digitaria exilis TaxID=1010633 RepID=A0A835BYW7_9POAL|nr:hypothetical protein HU200_026855 [Digitaria exilis]
MLLATVVAGERRRRACRRHKRSSKCYHRRRVTSRRQNAGHEGEEVAAVPGDRRPGHGLMGSERRVPNVKTPPQSLMHLVPLNAYRP